MTHVRGSEIKMNLNDRGILEDVKDNINGFAKEDDVFDNQLLDSINSVFTILRQIGVGPLDKQFIANSDSTWNDFLSQCIGSDNLEAIRTYMFERVKLIFDPPANSNLMQASKDIMNEMEWRLYISEDGEQF